MKLLVLLFILFSFNAAAEELSVDSAPAEKDNLKQMAKLQGLNKITAVTSEFDAEIGQVTQFGNLEITIHKCWESPPEEEPESKAIVEVFEKIPGEDKIQRFKGWIFASTPAISTLEHPVYGLVLIECHNKEVSE